jgi:lipocalin
MTFNPQRYQGIWYEFARTENIEWEDGCSSAKAEYKWDPLTNTMKIKNSCYDSKGDLVYSRSGFAIPTNDPFAFNIEFGGSDNVGNYTIESTDYDNYAIVTSYKKGVLTNLWILTRVAMPEKSVIEYCMDRAYYFNVNAEELRLNYVC